MVICYKPHGLHLRTAYDYVDRLLGPGITPYDQVVAMQSHHDEFVSLVLPEYPVDGGELGVIYGYYSLVPLTHAATAAMVNNQLYGAELEQSHMVKRGDAVSGIFVGAVVAEDGKGPIVLRSLHRSIASLCAGYNIPVLARPVTEMGKKIMEKYGFTPLSSIPREDGRINYQWGSYAFMATAQPKS